MMSTGTNNMFISFQGMIYLLEHYEIFSMFIRIVEQDKKQSEQFMGSM